MANVITPVLQQEPPLKEFTEAVRRNVAINWYRTKLPPDEMKKLHVKSDLRGAAQTLGYLACLLLPGGLAWYSFNHWSWGWTAAFVFLYGMVVAFAGNAVHELGHGTVFRTKWLNSFFCHVFSFLSWLNHETFQSSHIRHHRYTLHPPDDLEVVLPMRLMFGYCLRNGIVNPFLFFRECFSNIVRIAAGKFRGEWELTLYPESDPEARRVPVRWARCILAGHLLIWTAAILTGQWILILLSCAHLTFGSWLFLLCNNTQHVGLMDNVDDFRLCCRTFTLNPAVSFLYWQMNYHTEHHMYAAVPCYNLKPLHRLIKHDLPPTPHGLLAVWKEIDTIVRRQIAEPGYQFRPPLPVRPSVPAQGRERETAGRMPATEAGDLAAAGGV